MHVLIGGPFFPLLTQQAQNVQEQHDVTVFGALRLHDTDDLLRAEMSAGTKGRNWCRLLNVRGKTLCQLK